MKHPRKTPTRKIPTRLSAATAALESMISVLRSVVEQRLHFTLPIIVLLLVLATGLALLALFPAISPFVYPLI